MRKFLYGQRKRNERGRERGRKEREERKVKQELMNLVHKRQEGEDISVLSPQGELGTGFAKTHRIFDATFHWRLKGKYHFFQPVAEGKQEREKG